MIYLYLLATFLFIAGIKGLTGVRSARRGNQIAAVGMFLAVVTTLIITGHVSWPWAIVGMILGGGIGYALAVRVQLTQMPELVAIYNGLGGAASTFVALSVLAFEGVRIPESGTIADLAEVGFVGALTLPITILIGTVTLTGSYVAYLKLAGKKLVHPLAGVTRHYTNAAVGLVVIVLGVLLVLSGGGFDMVAWAALLTVVSGVLGVFLVLPIGGADMPVVVALLNSYSGLAAAASGFVIKNPMLIVAGALVGASGIILTRIMCKAMNRSLGNVLLGGIGDDTMADDAREYTNIKETSPEEVAMLLDAASSVIVVPGYGLAVAQAQHALRQLEKILEEKGVDVRYAIHPVAGRMPGHMNVLLAEADVPYDKLFELERINDDFKNTDVVIVVGANDVVNPAARDDPHSPIAGMPILNVDEARTVVVIKRSLSPGYAGIKNPLFEKDNTLMVFMDAKEAIQKMVSELKEL